MNIQQFHHGKRQFLLYLATIWGIVNCYLVLNGGGATWFGVPGAQLLRLAVREAGAYEEPVAPGTGEASDGCYHLVPEICTCVPICFSHSDRHFLMKMNLHYQMDSQFNLAGNSSGMHCRPCGWTCRLAKRRLGQLCLAPG